jgi:hypothetical protein
MTTATRPLRGGPIDAEENDAPVTIDLDLPPGIAALRGIALRSATIARSKSRASERRAANRAANAVEREAAAAAYKTAAATCWMAIAAAQAGDLLPLFDGKTILAFGRVSVLGFEKHLDRASREEGRMLIDEIRELFAQKEDELAALVAAEGRDPHIHNYAFWCDLRRLVWNNDLRREEAHAALVRFVDRGLRETSGETAAGSALFFLKQPRP